MQYEYERFLQELGARVRKLRTGRKLTHRQMIAEHGFHLNRIEKGEPVSVQTLLRLCSAFDLKMAELLDGLG